MSDHAETGVLVIVHGDYGTPIVQAAELLVGPLNVRVTMVCQSDEREELERRILREVDRLDRGGGVLMLADLCGSTPVNCCTSITKKRPGCVVVTGLNLPMLMKLATCDRRIGARALALELHDTAKRCIIFSSTQNDGGGECGG
jgi:mannose/fructose-specific phosphotransferase system component IIA